MFNYSVFRIVTLHKYTVALIASSENYIFYSLIISNYFRIPPAAIQFFWYCTLKDSYGDYRKLKTWGKLVENVKNDR